MPANRSRLGRSKRCTKHRQELKKRKGVRAFEHNPNKSRKKQKGENLNHPPPAAHDSLMPHRIVSAKTARLQKSDELSIAHRAFPISPARHHQPRKSEL